MTTGFRSTHETSDPQIMQAIYRYNLANYRRTPVQHIVRTRSGEEHWMGGELVGALAETGVIRIANGDEFAMLWSEIRMTLSR